jgi:hypothetical protein
MASTYDASKDPNPVAASRASFGRKGAAIVPSDSTDLTAYAKAIVVTAAGNLVILPVENDDAATITFTGCAVGFIPPFQVRRVFSTGTTASVASILS